MNKHNQNLKRIINQIKVWIAAGITVLIFILVASVNWAQSAPDMLAWVLIIVGISGVTGWWAWTMAIIYQLIMQRMHENQLITHLIEQIKDIKNEIKHHLFK